MPTWNYEAVHVSGRLVVHDDAAWLDVLVRQLADRDGMIAGLSAGAPGEQCVAAVMRRRDIGRN